MGVATDTFQDSRFTFYAAGLGACGKTNLASDFITIHYNGKTHSATIMDECPGFPHGALDMSQAPFNYFASEDLGVIYGSWSFADRSGGGSNSTLSGSGTSTASGSSGSGESSSTPESGTSGSGGPSSSSGPGASGSGGPPSSSEQDGSLSTASPQSSSSSSSDRCKAGKSQSTASA
ncbi:hypothetical protein DFH11DRAFT_1760872 [Phellopilus nigrolimitatus]|nr:hypothetical protein DFH11DRAFT_1760872 [Phellopilus nigrolimitatus]